MAPRRKGHDNERVSKERSTPLGYVGKYEDLALTRGDNGLHVLRLHTAGGRVHPNPRRIPNGA
jgi:hypothetical protein